jgi:hypothetical protein
MIDLMTDEAPKKGKGKPKAGAGKKFPSRANYKSMYLPRYLWNYLHGLAETQDRSVSYMAKRAVEEYLRANGIDPKVPKADKPS